MIDKTMSIADIAAQVESGMTLAVGGWGGRRKPMAVIRELLKTEVMDLTVLAYGGPDIGMLAAAGKIRKLIFGFVSMDSVPLEGHYRVARQSGAIEVMEVDEGMFQLGLKAAAQRMPFLPTRVGFASDVLTTNPEIKTIISPYDDGEEFADIAAGISKDKKICIGGVYHRTLEVEKPEEVAALIRKALKYIEPERLIISSDCGFGRQGMSRTHAFYKMVSLVAGTNIVRKELGLEENAILASNKRYALM